MTDRIIHDSQAIKSKHHEGTVKKAIKTAKERSCANCWRNIGKHQYLY